MDFVVPLCNRIHEETQSQDNPTEIIQRIREDLKRTVKDIIGTIDLVDGNDILDNIRDNGNVPWNVLLRGDPSWVVPSRDEIVDYLTGDNVAAVDAYDDDLIHISAVKAFVENTPLFRSLLHQVESQPPELPQIASITEPFTHPHRRGGRSRRRSRTLRSRIRSCRTSRLVSTDGFRARFPPRKVNR